MFDHVTIRVADRDASTLFYTTVVGEPTYAGADFVEWKDFSLTETDVEHPATRHLHVAFAAPAQEEVDAFWRRGVEAGARSDGEPGPRPLYAPDYYGAFLLDPDGNSVEAVHRPGRTESGAPIDHLWLRVDDLDASRRFYATVAPVLGLRVGEARLPDMFPLAGQHRHAVFVHDGRPRTTNLHFAFPVQTDEAVAEFHRVATSAGYRDNGGPGERPQYHPGYYGAFVLDPDGNNVEAVNHNR
jgi:catechol 2,3-dioxygenase-like lactoylglutathione lyase family enzyme